MTTLFLLLSQFIINPTYEDVDYSKKDKQAIVAMINKSNYLQECSITWPLGMKKWTIVLGLVCVDKSKKVYNAKLWIDYIHNIYMRIR